jgi:hypothetical protein
MEARLGAMRIFFKNSMSFGAPRNPSSRLHLMRDPVNRPLSRPQRERAGLFALRGYTRSRIRCSWGLRPVRFRQMSRRLMMEDEHAGR